MICVTFQRQKGGSQPLDPPLILMEPLYAETVSDILCIALHGEFPQ